MRVQRVWSLTVLIIWILSGTRLSSVNGEAHLLNGASDACIATSDHPVDCPMTLTDLLADQDHSLNSTQLKDLCEGPCLSSLVRLRDLIKEECGSNVTRVRPSDGSLWKPTYLAERAIYVVNHACYKRGNGQYCNEWFQNPSSEAPLCDECWQFIIWHDAQFPLLDDNSEYMSAYASVSSSCGYAEQPTHTYEPLRISLPTTTPVCSSKYTIKAGDTFLSVSKSQRVATHDLASANRLDYQRDNFPSSGELCIRHQCDVYVVKEGDTCESIQVAHDITRASLGAWNPFINHYCDNVSSYVNQTICVSNPRGECKSPKNKTLTFSGPPAEVPNNIAPETRIKCGLFHNVTVGDDCGTIGLNYSISLGDLIFLNPTIWQNCTNLSLGTSYCVAPVGDIVEYPGYIMDEYKWMSLRDGPYVPIANGTREDCWEYFWWDEALAGSPISCLATALAAEIDVVEQLFLWNPSLDQNWTETDDIWPPNNYPCTIAPYVSYCVQLESPTPTPEKVLAIPSPRAAGEIGKCVRWFMGYWGCERDLSYVKMSMRKAYRYNSSLKEDCSGYTLGTHYCVETLEDVLYGHNHNREPTSTQSAPTTSGASSDTTQPTNMTPDGTCGGDKGYNCVGSQFGSCCSQYGYCRTSEEVCGQGCQEDYGDCL